MLQPCVIPPQAGLSPACWSAENSGRRSCWQACYLWSAGILERAALQLSAGNQTPAGTAATSCPYLTGLVSGVPLLLVWVPCVW